MNPEENKYQSQSSEPANNDIQSQAQQPLNLPSTNEPSVIISNPVAPAIDQQPTTPTVDQPGVTSSNASNRGKTFTKLHQHESPIAISLIVFVILAIVFNVLFALRVQHIRNVGYANYQKQQAEAYAKLPSTIAAKDDANFGPFLENRSNGTLDLKHLVNANYTPENQNISAGLNQQVNLADGESFMVTSVQPGWESVNPNGIKPSTGNYFILLNMVIGNRSTQAQSMTDISKDTAELNGKQLLNVDIYPFQSDFANSSTVICDSVSFNQFSPGQQQNCVLVIQVPLNSLPSVVFNSVVTWNTSLKNIQMKATIKL
ncbi:MAG: hypothetical protein ACYCPS_03765 [Candidatus Saccharimonadales bacterium]